MKVEQGILNDAVMSFFKVPSSYSPGEAEENDHDPFRNKACFAERIQSITATPPANRTPLNCISSWNRHL
jgi:hypothetical protein